MNELGWLFVLVGTAIGLATGLVPGLHINTVCIVYLALLPSSGPLGTVALAAAGTSHALSSNLPATYLGLPGEETLASALPAHRMLREGHGREALRVSLFACLAGLLAGILLILPYKWILLQPLNLLDWVGRQMPWILLAILLFLVLREATFGIRRVALCTTMIGLSGALGWISLGWSVQGLTDLPASPLLPLLSGLFGVPPLVSALRQPPMIPTQLPPGRASVRLGAAIGSGTAASAATAILPGLSSSVAVALAWTGRRTDDPRPILATQGVIATAHLVLSFAVLWFSLRARTGLAVAVDQLQPTRAWLVGAPPTAAVWILQACLAAAILAAPATLALDAWTARHVHQLPARALAAAALVAILLLALVFTGWSGLVLMAVAAVVGMVPLQTGIGRMHLTGCLLVPVVLMRFGFAP